MSQQADQSLIAGSALSGTAYTATYVPHDTYNAWWRFTKGNAVCIVSAPLTSYILSEVQTILDGYEF